MPFSGKSSGKGFTLIELLTVVAIISILASLLVPALSKAKTKARMIEEISAGRQLMSGFQQYADDNDNAVFPGYVSDPATRDNDGQLLSFPANARYPWRIVPYLAGSMKLIYSGENRAKLTQLESGSHADYVYSVSLFPSLGVNSYFIGGNQTEFPAADANEKFGAGTVVTRINEVKNPASLLTFISARSTVTGSSAQGYYQVSPPYLRSRQWASSYSPTLSPDKWGFVAPRFSTHAVTSFIDGHVQNLSLDDMQDMRLWCNIADSADYTFQVP